MQRHPTNGSSSLRGCAPPPDRLRRRLNQALGASTQYPPSTLLLLVDIDRVSFDLSHLKIMLRRLFSRKIPALQGSFEQGLGKPASGSVPTEFSIPNSHEREMQLTPNHENGYRARISCIFIVKSIFYFCDSVSLKFKPYILSPCCCASKSS